VVLFAARFGDQCRKLRLSAKTVHVSDPRLGSSPHLCESSRELLLLDERCDSSVIASPYVVCSEGCFADEC
jgi:hypothetical protein